MFGIGVGGGDLAHLPMAEIIRKADAMEVDDVELAWGQNVTNLEQVRELKRDLDSTGKTVNILNTFLFHTPEDLGRQPENDTVFWDCLKAARVLGSRFMLLWCACRPAATVHPDESRREIDQYLQALVPYVSACRSAGITLVVENHASTLLRTPESTLHLLRQADPLGLRLAFDPSNYYNSGAEPYPLTYRLLKPYISVLHVKDSATYSEAVYGPDIRVVHRVIDAVFLPVGTGGTNWDGLCAELKQDGFDGPIIIEPHTALGSLDEAFAGTVRFLRARGLGLR